MAALKRVATFFCKILASKSQSRHSRSCVVLKKGSIRVISILLLLILGSGILKTAFDSYFHESHELSYLEFAHVHMHGPDEHEDCHGSMVSGLVFIPVSFNQFSDLILQLKFEYTTLPNSIYQDPDSYPLRKPPRFS